MRMNEALLEEERKHSTTAHARTKEEAEEEQDYSNDFNDEPEADLDDSSDRF